ncbi:unnamed protein product [Durusdinium trenchii]|uniref:dolichyl-phosphate-mannose--protein mannosyltransferase n=2 Tax=Durusdinium trenchii TaxID=1381693 RepID=A0ABP0N0E0_9DINO
MAGRFRKATTVAKSKEEFLSHVNAIAGADVGGLAKGVDKVLLRQRAAELQQICNEISAVRESQGKTTRSVHESRWMELASYAFVVALTLPYYVCLTYRSWFVDEGFAIYRNPDAKGETPLLQVLRNDFWGTSLNPPEGYITHKSWRPLITLMYAGEWLLCARYGFEGLEMQPMRFVSCVVHSLNSALLLWAMRLASLPLSCACLGASLFAAHPIHVENIVYLVGRADALSTTFYLLALIAYLLALKKQQMGLRSYALFAMLNVLSGLCKEPGFTALFYLACVELGFRCRWHHVSLLLLLFLLVAALRTWYVGGTDAGFGYVDTPIRYQDERTHGSSSQAWLVRSLSYLFQHAYYGKLLVLPWNQSWDYSFESLPMLTTLKDLRLSLILALYLAVTATGAVALRLRGAAPALLLGLGLIVVPFVPMSNLFFLVGTTIGERLLYPLTAGWALLVAGWAARARVVRWAAAGLLAIYIINSNIRMSHWRSPAILFMKDAEHWHKSVKVLHAKASELQAKGQLPEALEYYQRSLDIFDDQAITDYCIARILINLGRLQEAYDRFDKILNGHGIGLHDGNDFLWMTDLGYLLVRLGSDAQGAHYLQEGLRRMPYSSYGWNALGVAQARQGQLQEALDSLNQGLQIEGENPLLWSNMATIYAYGQAPEQALQALNQALRLNAAHPAVARNAQALSGAGQEPVLELYIPYPGRGGR